MRHLLLLVGFGCLGYCAYMFGMESLNQSYGNWVFEQHIAGRSDVSVASYLRATPFSFLVKDGTTKGSEPEVKSQTPNAAVATGAILGKVEIGRLNLSSVVREGVDAGTLSTSVGHVPSSAMPGHAGNFALAAHRDTLFRPLRNIKQNDLITFQSLTQTFTYKVENTRIVKPTDVSVLQSNGHDALTLITCYPFYYVGSAPERVIVQARLVSQTEPAERNETLDVAARARALPHLGLPIPKE
jgi:sortase A